MRLAPRPPPTCATNDQPARPAQIPNDLGIQRKSASGPASCRIGVRALRRINHLHPGFPGLANREILCGEQAVSWLEQGPDPAVPDPIREPRGNLANELERKTRAARVTGLLKRSRFVPISQARGIG